MNGGGRRAEGGENESGISPPSALRPPPHPIRLIASDLDGTLLRSDRSVSDRTRAALAAAQERGIVVVLATARPPLTTRLFADQAGITGHAICSNGAILYDIARDELLGHQTLDAAAARRLIVALRDAAPGVCFALVQGMEFACEPNYAAIARVEDHGRLLDEIRLGEALALLASPTTKLVVRHPERLPPDLLTTIQGLGLDGFEATHSGAPFLEVVAAGVTKGWALAELCAMLGIDAAEVVAFGDAPNDAAMLRWAGHGVAVANAYSVALEAADEVTHSNDEDGVAVIMERLLD
ncbi:MAG TPA: HAD family hydrolase [Thermomicrobiales bacterium]|nr:HAD family hydrolase [Thermomicrobiales bacterium]